MSTADSTSTVVPPDADIEDPASNAVLASFVDVAKVITEDSVSVVDPDSVTIEARADVELVDSFADRVSLVETVAPRDVDCVSDAVPVSVNVPPMTSCATDTSSAVIMSVPSHSPVSKPVWAGVDLSSAKRDPVWSA